jgi:hypothetical protein
MICFMYPPQAPSHLSCHLCNLKALHSNCCFGDIRIVFSIIRYQTRLAISQDLVKWSVDMTNVSETSQIDEKTGMLAKLRARLYPTMSRYFRRSTLVEGKLKDTNEPFRCLFVENTPLSKYIIPRMYGQSPVILKDPESGSRF